MATRGKPFAVQYTPDPALFDIQRRVSDVFDQLEDDRRGMLVGTVLPVTSSGELSETLVVAYSGKGGHTMRLPPASLRGVGRSQSLMIANQGTGTVVLVPSGKDTLNGISSLGVNATALLWSDGATKWHQVSAYGSPNGANCVASDYVLSAAWGSTASVSVATASKDYRGRITVTSNGVGIAANPTITFTYKVPYASAPFCIVARNGGTGASALVEPTWTTTATTWVATFPGTPVAGLTYIFEYMVAG